MPVQKYSLLKDEYLVVSLSGFRWTYRYMSKRRQRAMTRPGMTMSPRPSMAKSEVEPGLGASSLIGASMPLATVTITGVAKTCRQYGHTR